MSIELQGFTPKDLRAEANRVNALAAVRKQWAKNNLREAEGFEKRAADLERIAKLIEDANNE